MERLKQVLAVIGLVLVTVLLIESADADVFKIGCVATYDTTASVPVFYGGHYPYPDSIVIFKATIDYDGSVARFRNVQMPLGNGWSWVEVNDNAHGPDCGATPPMRRLTVMAGAADPCGTTTMADAVFVMRFGRVSFGTAEVFSPPGECFGILFTEAFNCLANHTVYPQYLGGGCVAFLGPTAIEQRSWTVVKRLYR